MNKLNDVLIENDKFYAPFLLAASFQGLVKFLGSYTSEGVIYWQFAPKKDAQELINQFQTKTSPNIPAKDLFEATEAFWIQVNKARKERYA